MSGDREWPGKAVTRAEACPLHPGPVRQGQAGTGPRWDVVLAGQEVCAVLGAWTGRRNMGRRSREAEGKASGRR